MSLFNTEQLARAIECKDRSYEFLKLFEEDKFRLRGKLPHKQLQETELSNFEKFKTMVLAHYLYLPENSRPETTDDRDVDEFCNFFLSYLFSSFEYVRNPKPRLITETGCYCDLCARLTSVPYLKLKKVTNRDKRKADKIQREVVHELASSAGFSLTGEQQEELLRNESLAESLALVSYGLELIRRCKGEQSDPSSLVLWRRFAWNKSGSPKKDFILQAEMILDAEKLLESKIREFGKTQAV